MEKLERKGSLLCCMCLLCYKIALFSEELGQPQPHDEGKSRSLQIWPHHGPWPLPQIARSELCLDTLLFFLPSMGIVT